MHSTETQPSLHTPPPPHSFAFIFVSFVQVDSLHLIFSFHCFVYIHNEHRSIEVLISNKFKHILVRSSELNWSHIPPLNFIETCQYSECRMEKHFSRVPFLTLKCTKALMVRANIRFILFSPSIREHSLYHSHS